MINKAKNPDENSSGPDDFTDGMFPNSFMESHITVIPKPHKH